MGLDPPRHLTLFTPANLRTAAKMAGHSYPQVSTSCANAQAFAVGSFEIESKGRYDMGSRPAWRSQFSPSSRSFARERVSSKPRSGDELIMRCRA